MACNNTCSNGVSVSGSSSHGNNSNYELVRMQSQHVNCQPLLLGQWSRTHSSCLSVSLAHIHNEDQRCALRCTLFRRPLPFYPLKFVFAQVGIVVTCRSGLSLPRCVSEQNYTQSRQTYLSKRDFGKKVHLISRHWSNARKGSLALGRL